MNERIINKGERVNYCQNVSDITGDTIPSPHTIIQLHTSPLPRSPTTNVSVRCCYTTYLHNKFVPEQHD
jgi:hypothetical protein